MKLKAKINRCNYERGMFRIFSAIPLGGVPEGLKLSKWGTFSIKGDLPYLIVDKDYEFILEVISEDPKYGSTCEVIDVPSLSMIDTKNLPYEESFQILRQIGTSSDRLAKNILDAYPNFIDIILNEGKEAIDLKKIKGVGKAYLNAYSRNILEKYKYWYTTKRLQQYNITIRDAQTLVEEYHDDDIIEENLEENPYHVMIDILEMSFDEADKEILKTRKDEFFESLTRCAYFLGDVMQVNEQYGHTKAYANELYDYASENYNHPEFLVEDENGETLMFKAIKDSEVLYYDEEEGTVALRTTYNQECAIRDFIINKIQHPNALDIDWTKYTNVDGFMLTDEQSQLLKSICENDVSILIGKAGSGKTSSVKALVKMMDDNCLSYTLLAPTGAAALRLANQTNRPASTIHRKYYRDKEINSDVIVVDEMSMVGVDVIGMLLEIISNPKVKIVFTGDPFQLPSISKGCVFNDIISSNKVNVIELTKVFRYDTFGGAFVGENVRIGQSFFDDDRVTYDDNKYTINEDYKFIETRDIFENVVNEYIRLRETYEEDEIIILSPYNVGDEGTYRLNETLENIYILPKANEKVLTYKLSGVDIVFRVGSRIVNTKNDYKALPYESWILMQQEDEIKLTIDDVDTTQIFNGQLGRVLEVGKDYLITQFDEEMIVFTKDKIENLLLARAISTHRSQGGEFKAVINVVSPTHERLLSKQLLYVADTRMREKHIDIGNRDTFERGLTIDVVEERMTWLKDLLENA